MLHKKNINAYSVLDYNQCNYKTSLDFINPPKNFPELNDPWLEIVRKIGIEQEQKVQVKERYQSRRLTGSYGDQVQQIQKSQDL